MKYEFFNYVPLRYNDFYGYVLDQELRTFSALGNLRVVLSHLDKKDIDEVITEFLNNENVPGMVFLDDTTVEKKGDGNVVFFNHKLSSSIDPSDQDIDEIALNEDAFVMPEKNFRYCLDRWREIIDKKPSYVLLHHDEECNVTIDYFDSSEQMKDKIEKIRIKIRTVKNSWFSKVLNKIIEYVILISFIIFIIISIVKTGYFIMETLYNVRSSSF